jgi:hypothetical protein
MKLITKVPPQRGHEGDLVTLMPPQHVHDLTATRRDVVELVCQRGDAIREYGRVPFAVLGQHLRVDLSHSRWRHCGFRDRRTH